MRAMDPFGGGLGGHGEVCGLVVGGLAVIGLRTGRAAVGDPADTALWVLSRRFLRRFREEVGDGAILCRDIAGVDWLDPVQAAAFRTGPKYRHCRALTGKTARLIGELLGQADSP